MAKKPTSPNAVDSMRHQDKRTNIPTNELRGFVEGDEAAPGTMLYPRDPSLDPQLVWKGKDEQDARDLEVPVVPIYIQEKILPQAIIENLRDTARKGEPEPELTLFNDYDGIEFQELVEFYRHEQNWANRMILGDSLLVMTSLAEKEGLKGKVQMIYMDPPYGIKFGSNWQVSTRKRDVKDGKAEDATRQPEQIKAFRDTWELGIHSYLAYLRDRLTVARELLTESGSIFVQIGDENVHLVRSVMDEVFGSENSVAHRLQKTTRCVARAKSTSSRHSATTWFGTPRDRERRSTASCSSPRPWAVKAQGSTHWSSADGERASMTATEKKRAVDASRGSASHIVSDNLTSAGVLGERRSKSVRLRWESPTSPAGNIAGRPRGRPATSGRRQDDWSVDGASLSYVRFLDDFPAFPLVEHLDGHESGRFGDGQVLRRSNGTEGHRALPADEHRPGRPGPGPYLWQRNDGRVAEQWGRRWITATPAALRLLSRARGSWPRASRTTYSQTRPTVRNARPS